MSDKTFDLSGAISLLMKGISGGKQAVTVATDDAYPLKLDPRSITLTQTIVVLAAATSTTLITANPDRKFLAWMVVGLNPVTIVPGAGPAVAGSGMNYNAGSSTINQGGSQSFEGPAVPTNAFAAISTGGSTVVVWEGE